MPESLRLKVPYQSQRDNSSGTGYRECFSSSCAMVAMYHGRIGSDDAYNRVRKQWGDTTSAEAHISALKTLGLKASFVTNGSPDLLRSEIALGRPVAVGWIHKGSILSGPVGGGHWSVVIGFTPSATIHHDPFGEADIIRGGYINADRGAGIAYSWRNWRQRWEVRDQGGVFRFSPGNGWALLVKP